MQSSDKRTSQLILGLTASLVLSYGIYKLYQNRSRSSILPLYEHKGVMRDAVKLKLDTGKKAIRALLINEDNVKQHREQWIKDMSPVYLNGYDKFVN